MKTLDLFMGLAVLGITAVMLMVISSNNRQASYRKCIDEVHLYSKISGAKNLRASCRDGHIVLLDALGKWRD